MTLPVLKMGDRVVVTGVVSQWQGNTYIHIYSADNLQVIGSRRLKRPKRIRARHLADQVGERIEHRLVELRNVALVDGDEFPPGGFNAEVRVVDSKGDTAAVWIDKNFDIDGTGTPNGRFNLRGVAYQFTDSVPDDDKYLVAPRGLFDIR